MNSNSLIAVQYMKIHDAYRWCWFTVPWQVHQKGLGIQDKGGNRKLKALKANTIIEACEQDRKGKDKMERGRRRKRKTPGQKSPRSGRRIFAVYFYRKILCNLVKLKGGESESMKGCVVCLRHVVLWVCFWCVSWMGVKAMCSWGSMLMRMEGCRCACGKAAVLNEHRGFQNFHDNAEYELKAKTNKQNRKDSNIKIFRNINIHHRGEATKQQENSKTRTKNIRECKNTPVWKARCEKRQGGRGKHTRKNTRQNTTLLPSILGWEVRARLREKKTNEIKIKRDKGLYSTCASPVVPHPSTRHAHGCLASEIRRDPAFPARYDRTGLFPVVSSHSTSRPFLCKTAGEEVLDRNNIWERMMLFNKMKCEKHKIK